MRVQSSEKRNVVSNFRGLLVWQKSRELVNCIYRLSQSFPKEEMYGLTSQMRRSAVSLISNLAEGSSKRSTKEFIRFINITYGSLAELEAQTIIAEDLGYVSDVETSPVFTAISEIGRMLNALQNDLHKKLDSELNKEKILEYESSE